MFYIPERFIVNKLETKVGSYRLQSIFDRDILLPIVMDGDGGATRLLPEDGGAEEFRGGPTVGPYLKVWTRIQK